MLRRTNKDMELSMYYIATKNFFRLGFAWIIEKANPAENFKRCSYSGTLDRSNCPARRT